MLLQLVLLDAVRIILSIYRATFHSHYRRYFGRRTVYVWGMAAMAIELCLIGLLNVWTSRPSVAWAQAVLTLVWTFTFQLSAGQLGKSCTEALLNSAWESANIPRMGVAR